MYISSSELTTPAALDEKCREAGQLFLFDQDDPPTDEYAHFYFSGIDKATPVIFDATLYTLRLTHESEMYAEAEKRALEKFPDHHDKIMAVYDDGDPDANPSPQQDLVAEEIGLFMAEVMVDLEVDEAVKVQEHVDVHTEVDVGIGLDVGLNVREVNQRVIDDFIRAYRDGTLRLDPVWYSFQSGDEDGIDDEDL